MILVSGKYFSFYLLFISIFSFGQSNAKIDSLETLLKSAEEDTSKVNLLLSIANEMDASRAEKGIEYSQLACEISQKLNFNNGEIKSLISIGKKYFESAQYEEANNYFRKAREFAGRYGNKDEEGTSLYLLGASSLFMYKYDTALLYFIDAEKILEITNNKKWLARTYVGMGNLYNRLNQHEKQFEYMQKALLLSKEAHDEANVVSCLINIGNYYSSMKDPVKAIEYYKSALPSAKKFGLSLYYSNAIANIGAVFAEMKKFDSALVYMREDLGIRYLLNDKYGIANTTSNIGSVLNDLGQYDSALYYTNKGIEACKEANALQALANNYENLSAIYYNLKQYQKAYDYHKIFSDLQDSLLNEDIQNRISDLTSKFEKEKQQNQISLLEEKNEKQNRTIVFIAIGSALLLLLVFVVFNRYRIKRNAHRILEEQNKEINLQKYIIEQKNKDITDSINYAQRIQHAILPDWQEVENFFPDSFVFYKPRDIISGDFYWFSEKNNHVLLAACDCTGHGVPGALMSMIGSSLLHQIVNEKTISDPAEVLGDLDRELTKALHQYGKEGESRDGMDIAFVEIDKQKRTLRYAGANRPIYLVRNKQLLEIQSDKIPIGGFLKEKKFNTKINSLFPGDMIYLFSDGYADQFGGNDGKKFMTRNLKKLLLSFSDKSMREQKTALETTLDDWKENREQLDDVLVICIKI